MSFSGDDANDEELRLFRSCWVISDGRSNRRRRRQFRREKNEWKFRRRTSCWKSKRKTNIFSVLNFSMKINFGVERRRPRRRSISRFNRRRRRRNRCPPRATWKVPIRRNLNRTNRAKTNPWVYSVRGRIVRPPSLNQNVSLVVYISSRFISMYPPNVHPVSRSVASGLPEWPFAASLRSFSPRSSIELFRAKWSSFVWIKWLECWVRRARGELLDRRVFFAFRNETKTNLRHRQRLRIGGNDESHRQESVSMARTR